MDPLSGIVFLKGKNETGRIEMANLVNIVFDHCPFDVDTIEIGDVVYFRGVNAGEEWSVVDIFMGVTEKVLKLRITKADGGTGQTFVPITEVYSLWRQQ